MYNTVASAPAQFTGDDKAGVNQNMGESNGTMEMRSSRTAPPTKTLHFKLVLLGDTAVGKSCLVVRFAKDEFYPMQESTIGAAFMTQSVRLADVLVKFEIWDTAGQERYRSLAPMYYRGASAALVVYDISNRTSFEGAKTWINELSVVNDKQGLVIALAGNKDDLVSERIVKTEEAAAYAEEHGLLFMETSAKTGHNVNKLFYEIARMLPKNREDVDPHAGFQLSKQKVPAQTSWCACYRS